MEALFPLLIAGLGIFALVAALRAAALLLRLAIICVIAFTLWNMSGNKSLRDKTSRWLKSHVALSSVPR